MFRLSKNLSRTLLCPLRTKTALRSFSSTPIAAEPSKKVGFIDRIWGKNTNPGTSKTNRWLMFLPCVGVHMCYGTPYAWSVFSQPLTRQFGFLTSTAADWTLSQVSLAFPLSFAALGIAAFSCGKLQLKLGVRKSLLISGMLLGTGTLLGSLGIATHSLPLLYLGYGAIAGFGIGFCYTPPVQTLIQWFPDRKGIASGCVLAGFGSGSILLVPIASRLMQKFQVLPTYLGPQSSLSPVMENGKLMATLDGQAKEVVLATASDIKRLGQQMAEGYYLAGTGNTGVAQTLAVAGCAYLAITFGASLLVRTAPAGYLPAGYKPATGGSAVQGNVSVDQVMKLPQFYQMFTIMLAMGIGGLGMFSVAKPMMMDIFSSQLPSIVTPSFASAYVMMLSLANVIGRIGWAAVSDKIGRRLTFNLFCFSSIPLYLAIPACISALVANPSALPLSVFVFATCAGVANMGAMYALFPSYESDMYGSKYVGAIHGRVMLSSVFSSLGGSALTLYLRNQSENKALRQLLTKVDPDKFQQFFHAPLSSADSLIQSKVLTCNRLMQIMPAGTPDPSPFLFNNVMYTMATFVALASLTHLALRPVAKKYFEQDVAAEQAKQDTVTKKQFKQP
eukprot:TRINITY_DN1029_c0_g1_i1.p1 TRINITY_DN1029_c0_g1~~TRINITY_DN1029_c0_g1_i1.p1  ORF type:complete len:617 (-),score=164.91 TRINITY_DN1029_c0_g1_i1:505-2355(-)